MTPRDFSDKFDKLRPYVSSAVFYDLARLLCDLEPRFSQAQWEEPQAEQNLTIDVFTDHLWFHAHKATQQAPATITIEPLVVTSLRGVDDNFWITIGNKEVAIVNYQQSPWQPSAIATSSSKDFLTWVIRDATWVSPTTVRD